MYRPAGPITTATLSVSKWFTAEVSKKVKVLFSSSFVWIEFDTNRSYCSRLQKTLHYWYNKVLINNDINYYEDENKLKCCGSKSIKKSENFSSHTISVIAKYKRRYKFRQWINQKRQQLNAICSANKPSWYKDGGTIHQRWMTKHISSKNRYETQMKYYTAIIILLETAHLSLNNI